MHSGAAVKPYTKPKIREIGVAKTLDCVPLLFECLLHTIPACPKFVGMAAEAYLLAATFSERPN